MPIPSHIDKEKLWLQHSLKQNEEVAKIYGISRKVLKSWIRELKKELQKKLEDKQACEFPNSSTPDFCDYITIDADKAIILGDAEIPDHDATLFQLAYNLGSQFDIKTLIVNGDFLALDSFSSFARDTVHKLAFKEELEPAIKSLSIFLSQFSQIIWITGNHESRLSRKIEGHLNVGDFLTKFSDGIQFSEYSYMILTSGGKEIMVGHPSNYSRVPLSVPREMAAVKHMNVICGHTHHLSLGYDRSGNYFIAESGCCRNPLKTRYKQLKMTTFPSWNPGFIMILNGSPFLITHENAEFWTKVQIGESND
jgi:predicted phosphodiesterase